MMNVISIMQLLGLAMPYGVTIFKSLPLINNKLEISSTHNDKPNTRSAITSLKGLHRFDYTKRHDG